MCTYIPVDSYLIRYIQFWLASASIETHILSGYWAFACTVPTTFLLHQQSSFYAIYPSCVGKTWFPSLLSAVSQPISPLPLFIFFSCPALPPPPSQLSDLCSMSSYLSGAPNGLPWLAEDNFLKWQEQVMAYLQCKQIAQSVEGWAQYLLPNPLTNLSADDQPVPTMVQAHATAVTTWRTKYDNWKIKDNMAMGTIKGTLCGQYLTYILSCTTSKAVIRPWMICVSTKIRVDEQ